MGTGADTSFTVIRLGSRTDTGKVRSRNEDNLLWFIPRSADEPRASRGALCVVADGMGGYAAGEVASKIAVDTIVEHYTASQNPDVRASLEQAVIAANTAIQSQHQGGRAGMGTTVVCAAVRGDEVFVAHVGDSRIYLYHQGRLSALTQDHSLVGEQVRRGLITDEEASRSEHRHIITRALGLRNTVNPDLAGPIRLVPGDAILLCTDGVCGYVRDEQIQFVLETHRDEPQIAADLLVDAANAAGGYDNATAAVLYVERVAPYSFAPAAATPPAEAPAARQQAGPLTARRALVAGIFAVLLTAATGLLLALATGSLNLRLTAPAAQAPGWGRSPAALVASLQPEKPLGTLDELVPFTIPVASSPASTVLLTLTLRTNASLAEPLDFSRDIEVSRSGNQVALQLAPQSAFSPSEQVKIEVLAESSSTSGADPVWMGTLGLPPQTSLRPNIILDTFINMRFDPPNQAGAIKVRLTVNWEAAGRIPGRFKPAIKP